jgi:predicted ferric reductase/Ca2+-binding EF-hand superfamily protein
MPEPALSLIDQELLSSLERAFAQHAGGDALIDATDLQKALGLQSEYLARRVLRAFDRDRSGGLDRREFITAVRGLLFGTERDKLEFAFRLHDDDGDGQLSEQELLRMISISLAEGNVISRRSQPPERLARAVFQAADSDRDGRVSYEEFARVMQRYPELLRKLIHSEAQWIAPNEALLARLTDAPGSEAPRLGRLVENRWLDLSVLAVWLITNLALFASALHEDATLPGSSPWLRTGRALAACLCLNGALIFVPVLPRLVARLRRGWLGRKLGIDDAVAVHRVLGQLLFALAVAHSAAAAIAYRRGHASLGMNHLFFGTQRGGSGALLLLVFAVIWAFSQAPIRRSQRFELFYFSHRLYWLWLVLLLVHAPGFAAWAALPVAWLVVESVSRRRRRALQTRVDALLALRSGVTRLDIKRPAGFRFDPGDYVFLNLPALAKHEWHPFTLSSAPEQDDLTVHVRSLGNWTKALRERAELREAAHDDEPMFARIDGPYGTPSARIFAARNVVLIGAGIGVTPFASVLASLAARAADQAEHADEPDHVHFFWLNRDQYSFEWFAALLSDLEQGSLGQRLDIHICLTGGHSGSTSAALEIAREVLHAEGKRDLVTGLRAKTHMGHPDWQLVLAAIAEQHAGQPVDVFFCGPVGLGARLRRVCTRTGLRFHEEKF